MKHFLDFNLVFPFVQVREIIIVESLEFPFHILLLVESVDVCGERNTCYLLSSVPTIVIPIIQNVPVDIRIRLRTGP